MKQEGCIKIVGKTFLKNLYERQFNAIKNGQKNVEIRANENVFFGNLVNLIEKTTLLFLKEWVVRKK